MKNVYDEFSLSQERRIRSQAGYITIGEPQCVVIPIIFAFTVCLIALYKGMMVEHSPWLALASIVVSSIVIHATGSRSRRRRKLAATVLLDKVQQSIATHERVLQRKLDYLKDHPEVVATKTEATFNENHPNRNIFADISDLQNQITVLKKEEEYFQRKSEVQQRAFN